MLDLRSLDYVGATRFAAIGDFQRDAEFALREYFDPTAATSKQRFFGYTLDELADELETRLDELEVSGIASMLFAFEATFYRDYEKRRRGPKGAPLCREFRALNKRKPDRVSFEKDLLKSWEQSGEVPVRLVNDLRKVIRLRHWLAHGRHWLPKNLGQEEYDFVGVQLLSQQILTKFPFILE